MAQHFLRERVRGRLMIQLDRQFWLAQSDADSADRVDRVLLRLQPLNWDIALI